jgi:transposase
MAMQEALFCGTDAAMDSEPAQHSQSAQQPERQADRHGAVRMRKADRAQVGMHFCSIDELVADDHQVRVVWDAVSQMDLSAFMQPIAVRQFTPGRSANDVAVMVALWLWAAVNNVARGRELQRRCERDLTFKWICGGLGMNYHTLNDFRVEHGAALDALFTATLGRLMHKGLVKIDRISQDGLRVRASAGSGSFRSRPRLEQFLAQAQAHLADLKKQAESTENDDADQQEQARQQTLAQDRLARVKEALAEVEKVEQSKAKQHGAKAERAARASTTDPQARNMKMPNGGFNPAYNVQLASDPLSRAIVGVMVSNSGADATLSEVMRKQVEQNTGQKVSEHLIDGGYVSHEAIDRAAEQEVTLYMPVPPPNKNAKEQDRYARRESDSEAAAAWRERMNGEAAREIYKDRAATSETINADLRTFRGMSPLSVRGIAKATCVALWSALAYNVMHFASALT